MNQQIDKFEEAFISYVGSCNRICNCGKEFYNDHWSWGWADGELDALRADPNAVSIDTSVGLIMIDGKEYVPNCNCWHERAMQIINFINSHKHQIARYLNTEKEYQAKKVAMLPTVEVPADISRYNCYTDALLGAREGGNRTNINEAVENIIDELDWLLCSKNFEQVDMILASVNPSKVGKEVTSAILTITYGWKDKLVNWQHLYETSYKWIEERYGVQKSESLLGGLREELFRE